MTKHQDGSHRAPRPRTVSSPIPVSPGSSRPLSPSKPVYLVDVFFHSRACPCWYSSWQPYSVFTSVTYWLMEQVYITTGQQSSRSARLVQCEAILSACITRLPPQQLASTRARRHRWAWVIYQRMLPLTHRMAPVCRTTSRPRMLRYD